MYRYIADLHIGCKNSFEWRTLEHDERIVKNWNAVVHNDDTTFILGDIGKFGKKEDTEHVCSIISRLRGRKILLVGNHDNKGLKDHRVTQLFDSIHDYLEVNDNYNGINQKLVLSHYPIFSWNGCYKNTVLLYGHVHNNFDNRLYQEALRDLRFAVRDMNMLESNDKKFKSKPYAYNVGVMMPWMNYTPKTYKEILEGVKTYEES